MTLSDTQRQVLTAAIQHPDGIAAPPVGLPPAPRAAVAKALLKAGLLASVEAEHVDAGLAWKLDGVATVLGITEAGRCAIDAAPTATGDSTAALGGSESLKAMDGNRDVGARNDADAAQQPPAEPQTATAKQTLRQAAVAVLLAWDAGSDRPGLPVAIDRLRLALAKPASAAGEATPRPRRQDTKQATVLALLRRAEGASGPQLIEATGWAPHTVRGFLAGLARKGITVTVLERVRQIGPNKQGAKGSYTIYRVADAS